MVHPFKSATMKYVIDFLIVFIIGYICSMSVVLIATKLFFPFYTKKELDRYLALLKRS